MMKSALSCTNFKRQTMVKSTQAAKTPAIMRAETQLTSIRKAASMAAPALARLDADASAATSAKEAVSSMQLVASAGDVTALIRVPGMVVEIENGAFAVTIKGEKLASET